MFRRILSWKTLSVLFWGTLKDKEFAGKGIVFRRGVCDGGSLISEAGELEDQAQLLLCGRGAGRRAGKKPLWSDTCPGLGASGEGLSYLALDPPPDKAALFQREGNTNPLTRG